MKVGHLLDMASRPSRLRPSMGIYGVQNNMFELRKSEYCVYNRVIDGFTPDEVHLSYICEVCC